MKLIKIILPSIRISHFMFDNVVCPDQDFMSHCNDCLLFASAQGNSFVTSLKISPLFLGGGVSALNQRSFEESVARIDPRAFFLPALSLFPGQIPAQEAKLLAEGN